MKVLLGQVENLKKLIMDNRSIGLCLSTMFLKVFADVSTNDFAMYVAIGAGITTIVYNIYKIFHEFKK